MLAKNLAAPDTANAGWVELVAQLAAARGDRELYDRIAAVARATRRDELRDALVTGLGKFGPDFAERGVATFVDGSLPPGAGWEVVHGYFERPATRGAAWKATRDHLPAILGQLAGTQARRVIEATGSLCDRAQRAEVAAAFASRVAGITDGQLVLDR